MQGEHHEGGQSGSAQTFSRGHAKGFECLAGELINSLRASQLIDHTAQACHAAYDTIDEEAVYNCTGNPDPKDIERVIQSMMSDEFGTSFNCELIPPLPRIWQTRTAG